MAKVDSKSKGFIIFTFIVAGLLAGMMLAVLVYFTELQNGTTLSSGEITSMLVVSGILFVITIVMFIWAAVVLFVNEKKIDEYSKKSQDYLSQKHEGYYGRESAPKPQTASSSSASHHTSSTGKPHSSTGTTTTSKQHSSTGTTAKK